MLVAGVLCLSTPCQMNKGELFVQAVFLLLFVLSMHDVDDPHSPVQIKLPLV